MCLRLRDEILPDVETCTVDAKLANEKPLEKLGRNSPHLKHGSELVWWLPRQICLALIGRGLESVVKFQGSGVACKVYKRGGTFQQSSRSTLMSPSIRNNNSVAVEINLSQYENVHCWASWSNFTLKKSTCHITSSAETQSF